MDLVCAFAYIQPHVHTEQRFRLHALPVNRDLPRRIIRQRKHERPALFDVRNREFKLGGFYLCDSTGIPREAVRYLLQCISVFRDNQHRSAHRLIRVRVHPQCHALPFPALSKVLYFLARGIPIFLRLAARKCQRDILCVIQNSLQIEIQLAV